MRYTRQRLAIKRDSIYVLFIFRFRKETVKSDSRAIYKIRDIKVRGGRDNTEEITKRVKRILIKKSGLYRRMVNAYPNFKIAVKQKKDMIKKKLEKDIIIKKS